MRSAAPPSVVSFFRPPPCVIPTRESLSSGGLRGKVFRQEVRRGINKFLVLRDLSEGEFRGALLAKTVRIESSVYQLPPYIFLSSFSASPCEGLKF